MQMAGSLLNADIDRKHRSTVLDANPGSLKHLVTRTPISNWCIHPDWLQRHVTFISLAVGIFMGQCD